MVEDDKLEGYYGIRIEKEIQDRHRKLPRETRRKISDKVRDLLRKLTHAT